MPAETPQAAFSTRGFGIIRFVIFNCKAGANKDRVLPDFEADNLVTAQQSATAENIRAAMIRCALNTFREGIMNV